MTSFTYHGTDKEGKKVSATVDVADRFAVYDIARTNGHTVVSVEETKGLMTGGASIIGRINEFIGSVK